MNHHSNRLPPEDESGARKKYSQQSLSADQLGHLVSRSMEGEITEAETELLQHHLKTDESSQDFFVEYASVHAMLTCHFQPLDLLETTGSTIRLVHREKKRKSKKKHWNALKSWQIALIAGGTIASVLVLVIGWSLLFSKPAPPEIVQVPSKKTQTIQPANTDWKGKRQTLTTGTLELHFPTGAKALVVAPATFIVTGDNSVRLLTGKLVANVPTSGIGFQVDTPRGRVVDLGTTFSVHATKELNTIVQVFRGKVIASLVDSKGVVQTSKQIEANHAVNIDFLKEDLVSIPYLSNDFIASLQKEHGIVRHSENVVFQEKMPASVVEGKYKIFEHDSLAFLFPEKKNVLLIKDLTFDLENLELNPTEKKALVGEGVIPSGTRVDSFRVYYDTVDNKKKVLIAEGEIHFDRPILGVIVSHKQMKKTELLFAPSLPEGATKRKISYQAIERNDEITISKDRKTLFFKLKVLDPQLDAFRILVQSRENPPR